MITRFTVKNFKRFQDASLDLGHAVVFIGPNNSGKTTALQAMSLWDVGVKRWLERRTGSTAKERTGVTLNRRDLSSIPIPSAKLLWRDLKTHFADQSNGKPRTAKVYITVTAEGVFQGRAWSCPLQFYYANEESLYCRWAGDPDDAAIEAVKAHNLVYLPPMSGLADREYRKEPGEIAVLIGEGQTAQVLRNLCYQLYSRSDTGAWDALVKHVRKLFKVDLQQPVYIAERSEISLAYRENGVSLDISSVGRGCQQVILLLSYMLAHPKSIMLLDEPDAHLEILRQRDIYNVLTDIADEHNAQIVAASHSEVILKEAGDRDVVIAFVGQPHRVDKRGRDQLKKALEKIPLADYYTAEQKGWILYVEGSTDLAILRKLAQRLKHRAQKHLDEAVPVQYLGSNRPQAARDHFHGLREAKPDLVGIAVFDRLDQALQDGPGLTECQWQQREIENYLVTPESLLGLARRESAGASLFDQRNEQAFQNEIDRLIDALNVAGRDDPWGPDIKVTDDFLDPLFKNYYESIGLNQKVFKRDYHRLADAIPLDQIDNEVTVVLDAIDRVASNAKPRVTGDDGLRQP